MTWTLLPLLLVACKVGDDPAPADDTEQAAHGVVPVGPVGPYGTWTFDVPAQAHWVNTGLYLRAGETVTFSASGTWTLDGVATHARGVTEGDRERGCPRGALALRSGLRFEGPVACLGAEGTFTAPTDDIVYVGMLFASDLGDTYGERLRLGGALEVTLSSDGDTAPTVRAEDLATYDLAAVRSGWVEVLGAHNLVTIEAAEVMADLDVAQASIGTLDQIYGVEKDLRGMAPYSGEPVRWFPDATIEDFAYMLAGNPTRCATSLMDGEREQRILRAADPTTDIWGFSHELGHSFSMANGTWTYQYINLESWPNIFTLRVLRTLDRAAFQPNVDSYCDGRDAYLAGGAYADLAADPFLQLCFLMDFEQAYGAGFYERFFRGMNEQRDEDVGYDGTDASVWRYVRDRFNLAAGEDTTARFEAWGVEL